MTVVKRSDRGQKKVTAVKILTVVKKKKMTVVKKI